MARRPTEEHALYVALDDPGLVGRQAAGYIAGVAAPLGAQHGVAFEVLRIRPKDFRDSRVLEALRRRGIDRLPAVLAGGRPLVGLAAIRAYYDWLLEAPAAGGGRGGRGERGGSGERGGREESGAAPAGGGGDPWGGPADFEDSPDADLDDYFRQELMVGRLDDEHVDAGFGVA